MGVDIRLIPDNGPSVVVTCPPSGSSKAGRGRRGVAGQSAVKTMRDVHTLLALHVTPVLGYSLPDVEICENTPLNLSIDIWFPCPRWLFVSLGFRSVIRLQMSWHSSEVGPLPFVV